MLRFCGPSEMPAHFLISLAMKAKSSSAIGRSGRISVIAARRGAVACMTRGASFDKLRMRGSLDGTKKGPHPELVEGRTTLISASSPDQNLSQLGPVPPAQAV